MRKAGWLRLMVFGLAGVLGLAATAHADTIVNFTFVNVTQFCYLCTGAVALTGTVDIDTTTGQFETIQATDLYNGYTIVFTGAPGSNQIYTSNYNPNFPVINPSPGGPIRSMGGYATLSLQAQNSLVGFTGGPLLTGIYGSAVDLPSNSTTGQFPIQYYGSGSLVPTASLSAVPEPSTWVLTGTALLGGLGGLSRRGRRLKGCGRCARREKAGLW